ncbi:glycoside hydrolase family 32 protein [Alkalihalobacillus sp. TS-13]|uniref:glycoside hydrolase family 32 protein n=1 Tax=Alkalihalobacillus sp. TS-13 TaxID=2842455 RepID=UPI001C873B5A|nr:glycoside hydrolase family 32 protein [Alkalihalobacillus sp. TS-13]
MTTNNLKKYRPHLHFAPKRNWMNDPNGLVYFKGEYHLFFQYHPNDSVWGPMHWGHAVSKNMIKWEELDIALYPDEFGMIFSGSAIVDWNNTTGFFPDEPGVVAIFTHHLENGEELPPVQTQSLAFSHDQGRTWTKYEGNPVLINDTKIDFRDPKVFWYEEADKWIMVVATGQTISFYSSPNLIDWQFESEFGNNIGVHDGVWECPDLFPLKVENSNEQRWVLIVSVGDNTQYDIGSQTQYFIGSFNGSTFIAENESINWLDFGKDNYAGVSFSDIPKEDGRRIYIGWMSNWRYANQVPTEGWRSQMTLPRQLSLRKSGDVCKLIQHPVKELEYFLSKEIEINGIIENEDGLKTYQVNKPYIEVVLNIEMLDANQFSLILHHTKEHMTTIDIDSIEKILKLDRSKSGIVDFSDNFSHDQMVELENTDEIQLRMVLDSSSIELFINRGEYALTSLIYPDQACEAISVYSSNGKVRFTNSYISTPLK